MKRNIHVSALALALSALVFSLFSTTPAKAGSFLETSAMGTARSGHTATLLLNGKVLIVGGWSSGTNGVVSTAEVHDPASGTWTTTGTMSIPRFRHTATLLPNGKVLVAGGYNEVSGALSSAEVYDPATGQWAMTAAMGTVRILGTATKLLNGKVLVAGGSDEVTVTARAELYDPATETWTETGSLVTGRNSHSAVLLPNGKVLVVAGGNRGDLSSSELYDPTTETWTVTGSFGIGSDGLVAVLLPNGRVLGAGGFSHPLGNVAISMAMLYDPSTGVWTTTNPMNAPHCNHTLTLLHDGKVLVVQGGGSQPSAEVYDPTDGTWTVTGEMKTGRYIHTATLLPNGKVLIAGGQNPEGILSSAELYDSTGSTSLRILAQPQSQIRNWGQTVSFSVTATNGTPPYAYQWRKGGVDISDATNSVLTLTNLHLADAGTYTVLVSDTVTNLLSQPATLTVNPAGVSIALYAGVTIEGVVGQTYGVQSTLDLSNTNSWVGRANVTLTNATQVWYDSQPATLPQTSYRVVPGPISIP